MSPVPTPQTNNPPKKAHRPPKTRTESPQTRSAGVEDTCGRNRPLKPATLPLKPSSGPTHPSLPTPELFEPILDQVDGLRRAVFDRLDDYEILSVGGDVKLLDREAVS